MSTFNKMVWAKPETLNGGRIMKKLIFLLSLCTLFVTGASQGPWSNSLAVDTAGLHQADSQTQAYKPVRQRGFELAEAGMNQRLQQLLQQPGADRATVLQQLNIEQSAETLQAQRVYKAAMF